MGYGRYRSGGGRGITWLREHVTYAGDECLTWPMSGNENGYGLVSLDGKQHKASRYMCVLAHGIPPSAIHEAAHSCGRGNKGCVNPRHLSWKTPSENRMDAVAHGTWGGGRGTIRKLTISDAERIRGLKGIQTAQSMAEHYGVKLDTVCKILRNETYVKPQSMVTREQIQRLRSLPATVTHKEAGRLENISDDAARRIRTGKTFLGVAT